MDPDDLAQSEARPTARLRPDEAVAVLILAGGEGRRIGGGKPLRPLGGTPLLYRALALARQWTDDIAIAARVEDQAGSISHRVLIDPPAIAGPLAGLFSALRLEADLVMTIPCDMPFLPADLPARLQAALAGNGAALAASGGRVHPVCALWRREKLAALDEYVASGRRSLIGFAQRIGYATVGWDERVFFNVNTAEDLAEAEARLA